MPNTKKSIQIKDSYKIWSIGRMYEAIINACFDKYHDYRAHEVLHRSYLSIFIEWWLHNIGYYLTRNIAIFDVINMRCKDVDLEERQ